MRTEHYCYRPLAQGNIRLVVIFPISVKDPETLDLDSENPLDLRCQIDHVNLKDNPQYEALSYCWGDATKTPLKIFSDDGYLEVTANLYNALLRIRGAQNAIRLWVDAICINQDDLAEKALQVPLMREIYSKCACVLTWLGEETPEVKDSLQFAEQLAYASRKDNIPPMKRYVWAFPNQHAPDPSDPRWGYFFALLRRPWFRRVWIIQELAISRKATLLCGHSRLPWDTMFKALDYTEMLGISTVYGDPRGLAIIKNLNNARIEVHQGHRRSLLKLMTRYRECLATNDRDKIFGLWGIADPNSIAGLKLTPDYEISVDALYKRFAKGILNRDRSLDIFQMVGLYQTPYSKELPSWVPDWSFSEPYTPIRHLELPAGENEVPRGVLPEDMFMATLDSKANPIFTCNNAVLSLQGYTIGKVKKLSCLLNHKEAANRSNPTELVSVSYNLFLRLQNWEKVSEARSGTKYRGGRTILDAYWQTLCGGWKPGGYAMAKEEFVMFDNLTRTAHTFMLVGSVLPFLHKVFLFQLVVLGLSQLTLLLRGYDVGQSGGFIGNCGAAQGRRMARIDNGYIALVPKETEVNDEIALLKGGKVPLVIRRVDEGGLKWSLVGEAYVHGVMRGEAFNDKKCERFLFI